MEVEICEGVCAKVAPAAMAVAYSGRREEEDTSVEGQPSEAQSGQAQGLIQNSKDSLDPKAQSAMSGGRDRNSEMTVLGEGADQKGASPGLEVSGPDETT